MVESQEQAEPSLVEFLTARARRVSDTRLVLDVAVGLVMALLAVIWRPNGWLLLVSAAACLASFGGWAITDRELRERPVDVTHGILRMTRVIAACLGALGAGALLIGLLGLALGTWIS